MKMETSPLLVYLLICFLLLQTYVYYAILRRLVLDGRGLLKTSSPANPLPSTISVLFFNSTSSPIYHQFSKNGVVQAKTCKNRLDDVSSLVLKGVHPHANVRMQFGAEHSPAPFSTNAKESAKIDGETHLGIEVPGSGDHHNILLHKVGTYLAVVMKALAKTVEPPQILDGSSTHLDFHVDAEFKEPQARVTITEKHPAEIVLQTLWTGDPQSIDTDITDLSSDLNGLIPGIANSEHFGNAQETRPTTNGILSILNLSPLITPHGLPLQGNSNFNLNPSNTGISENDLITSIRGSSINLNPSSQITGTIEQSVQKGIEGLLSNIVESETDKKLSQNTDTENEYFQLNEVNSHQETGNPQKVSLPINVGTTGLPNDPIFGLIAPTLGGVLPSSGNILLLNISMPLSEMPSVFTNETPFPGETQDFANPLHNFNLPSVTNILGSNSDGIAYPLSSTLRTILANQIFGTRKANSYPVLTLTDAFNPLLGEQVNSNKPLDTNLHEAQTGIINYPVPNVFPAAIDTGSTTSDQILTNSNAINPLLDNSDIMDPTFREQTNIHVPCNTNLRDDLVSKIRRDDTGNQYAGIGSKTAPTSITVNKEIPAPNVSRSSIAEQTKYIPSNSNLNRENVGRLNDPKFYSDSVNQNVHTGNRLSESVDSEKTEPEFVFESGKNLVIQTSELPPGTPLQHNETVHLSFHPNESNGISDIHLHKSSISSPVPAKSELIENMKTISNYPNYGLSNLELNKSNTIFHSRILADEKDNVSHGSHKYPHSVFTTSKHKLNEHKMYHTPDPFSKHDSYKYNMHDRDRSLGAKLENIQKSYSVTDQNYFSEVRSNDISSGSSHNQIFDKARSLPIEDIVHPFSHNETYSEKLNLDKNHLPIIHDSVLSHNLGNKSVHKTEDATPNKISKNVTTSDMTSVQITSPLQNDKESDRFLNGLENISNLGNILRSGSGYPMENPMKDRTDLMSKNENLISLYNDELANEDIKDASTILQTITAHKSQNKIDDVNDFDKMGATEKKIEQLTSARNKNDSDYDKIIHNFQNNTPLLYSIATDDTVSNITITNSNNYANKILSPTALTESDSEFFAPYVNNSNEHNRIYLSSPNTPEENLTTVSNRNSMSEDLRDGIIASEYGNRGINGSDYGDLTSVAAHTDIFNEQTDRTLVMRNNEHPTPVPYYTTVLEDIDVDELPERIFDVNQFPYNNIIEQGNMMPDNDYPAAPDDDSYFREGRKNVENAEIEYSYDKPHSTYILEAIPQEYSTPSYQGKYTHQDLQYFTTSSSTYENNGYQVLPEQNIQGDHQSLIYAHSEKPDYQHINLDIIQNNMYRPENQAESISDIHHNVNFLKNINNHLLPSPSTSYPETTVLPYSHLDQLPNLHETHATLEKENQIIGYNSQPIYNFQENKLRDGIQPYKSDVTVQDHAVMSPSSVETRFDSTYDLDKTPETQSQDNNYEATNINYIPYDSNKESDSRNEIEQIIHQNYKPAIQHDTGFIPSHNEVMYVIQPNSIDDLKKNIPNSEFIVPEENEVSIHKNLHLQPDSKYFESEYSSNLSPAEFHSQAIPDLHVESHIQEYNFDEKSLQNTIHNPVSSNNSQNTQLQILEVNPYILSDYKNVLPGESYTGYEYPQIQREIRVHNISKPTSEKFSQTHHEIQPQTTLNSTLEQKPSNPYISRGLMKSAHKNIKSELDHKSIYPDEQLESSSSPYTKIKNTDEPRSGNGVTEKNYQFDTHPVTSTYGITNSDDFSSPKVNSQAYKLNSDQHSSNYHEIKYYQSEDLNNVSEFYHSENEPYERKTVSTTMLPDENTKSSIYEYNIFENSPSNEDPNSRLHILQSDSVSNIYGLKNAKTSYPTDRETTYQNYDLQFTEKSYPLSEDEDLTMSRYEPKTPMIKLFHKPEKFAKKLHDRVTLEKPQSSENEYKLKLYNNETPSKSYLDHESRQTQLYEENNSSVTDYPVNYPVLEMKPFTNLHSSNDRITSELNLKKFPGNAYLLEGSPKNPIYEKITSMPLISSRENPKSQIYEDKISDKLYYSNDVSSFSLQDHKKSGVIANTDQNPLSHFRENKIPEKILNLSSLRFEKQPSAVVLEETPISQIYEAKYPGKVYVSESPSIPNSYDEESSAMSTQNGINNYDHVPQNSYKSGFSQLSTFHDTQTSRTLTQGNQISQSQETKTPEIRASKAFETHDLKSPQKLYHSSDNGKILSLSNEHLNPTFYENKLLSNLNNFKHTFEDKEKQKFIQDTNYPPSSPYNEIVNEAHSQYSIQPVDLNHFESETKKEANTIPLHNKNTPPSNILLDKSETQGNLQLTYQNYPVSSYYVVEPVPISSKNSSVQHQLENGVPPANSKIANGLDENSDPNVNKSTPQPGQVGVQEEEPSAVAAYPYYDGDEATKSRIICLTEQRDNIEILRSLKDDISKLKQKLNCE